MIKGNKTYINPETQRRELHTASAGIKSKCACKGNIIKSGICGSVTSSNYCSAGDNVVMNVLFVCDMGEVRSKTAAECLGFVSDFCGIDKLSFRSISELQINWADKIVCMEERHSLYVLDAFNADANKIQVWGIVDIYDYLDDTLITLLRGRAEEYLHCEK